MSMNLVILEGFVGQDSKLRYSQSGTAILSFTLATSTYRGKELEAKTEWHNVVVFGGPAESLANLIVKGSRVLVQGRISYDKWDKDGETRISTSIVASNYNGITLLNKIEKQSTTDNNYHPAEDISEEDIPF